MLIECVNCRMRDLACGECVVTALLDEPGVILGGVPGGVPGGIPIDIDERERRALAVLADAGLITPMRSIAQNERAS